MSLPETRLEPIVLSGEPPDPTRLPSGCPVSPPLPGACIGGGRRRRRKRRLHRHAAGCPAGRGPNRRETSPATLVACHLANALSGSDEQQR
jgi:hypothetical protein